MAGKNITITETGDIEKMLSTLPKQVATGPVLGNALAAAGKAVIRNAKPRVPRGDPKHHPEKKALWRTLAVVKRSYKGGKIHMAVVGPQYPAGAHGHLVEEGHDVLVSRGSRAGQKPLSGSPWVPGKEFMAPAITATKQQQETEIIESIRKEIIKHGG